MTRPLRDCTPDKVHLITCRSRNSELLLVPNPKINNCIGGIIAKYSAKYCINLYAAVALGNHYHILASAPDGNLHLFAENVNREIAKRINRMLGRSGSLWGRRYDDQIVVEPIDALEGLLYILTNPVKHGMVSHPRHWPGFTTYWPTVKNVVQEYSVTDYTELNKARRRAVLKGEYIRESDYETKYKIEIKPIPIFKELGANLRLDKVKMLIDKRARNLCDKRQSEGLGFLGRKAVLSQAAIGNFPKKTNRSKRPACYSKCPETIARFIEKLKIRRALYTESSIRFRLGDLTTEFPLFCFYPPRHHIPKTHQLVHS